MASFFTKTDNGPVHDVVDGKNRLITIRDFVHNKFPVCVDEDNPPLFYNELSDVVKSDFDDSGLSITTLDNTWKRDKVIDFFEELQGGVNLSVGEKIKGSCHPLAAVIACTPFPSLCTPSCALASLSRAWDRTGVPPMH